MMIVCNLRFKPFFSAFTISACVLLSRITGLIRDVCFASFLGTGTISDVFYSAFRLPNTFRRIFADGAFSNVFVPFCSSKMKIHRVVANDFSYKIMCVLITFLVLFTIVIEILMPSVVALINPGFVANEDKFALAVRLSRITFPYIVFISTTAFFGSILNSIGSFWQFAIVSVLLNFIFIVGLLLTNSLFSNAGECLSWLLIIAGIVQMTLLAYSCAKRSVFPSAKCFFEGKDLAQEFEKIERIKRKNIDDTKSFLAKILPAIISSGILQINIFVDGIFASFFSGAVSYLYYTDRIGQFPLSIIGYSLSVAILPSLSLAFQNGDREKISFLQTKSINIAMFLSIPATLLVISLARSIVSIVYQHGYFTGDDVETVSNMLVVYAISIPFNILLKIFFACFYSQKNMKAPMYVSIVSLILNVIVNIALIRIIGMYCVIVSTTISAILSCLLVAVILYRSGRFYVNFSDLKFSIKVLAISIISCVIIPISLRSVNIFIMLTIACFIHLVFCFMFNLLNRNLLSSFFRS